MPTISRRVPLPDTWLETPLGSCHTSRHARRDYSCPRVSTFPLALICGPFGGCHAEPRMERYVPSAMQILWEMRRMSIPGAYIRQGFYLAGVHRDVSVDAFV